MKVKQVFVRNKLYVLDPTAYEITEVPEGASFILVPEDSYRDYVELNPDLKLTKYNYGVIKANVPDWYEEWQKEEQEDPSEYDYSVTMTFENESDSNVQLIANQFIIEENPDAITEVIFDGNSLDVADLLNDRYMHFDESGNHEITFKFNGDTVPPYIFCECPYDSVQFGADIHYLGGDAFTGCMITNINIPANILSIGVGRCLNNSNIESITVADDNPVFTDADSNIIMEKETGIVVLGCQNSTLPNDDTVTEIRMYAFADATGLTDISIPSSVNKIEVAAFSNTGLPCENGACTIDGWCVLYDNSTANVVVDPSTTRIADGVFSEVENIIDTVTLPEGLEYIDYEAFFRCRPNMTSITIPSTVSRIGSRAFSENFTLSSITILADPPVSITDDTFTKDNGIYVPTIYVPAETVTAYQEVWANIDPDLVNIIQAIPEPSSNYMFAFETNDPTKFTFSFDGQSQTYDDPSYDDSADIYSIAWSVPDGTVIVITPTESFGDYSVDQDTSGGYTVPTEDNDTWTVTINGGNIIVHIDYESGESGSSGSEGHTLTFSTNDSSKFTMTIGGSSADPSDGSWTGIMENDEIRIYPVENMSNYNDQSNLTVDNNDPLGDCWVATMPDNDYTITIDYIGGGESESGESE